MSPDLMPGRRPGRSARTQPLLMNLTSIWSVPATVVTVPRTWAPGFQEPTAPIPGTGCTMLGTGCQIVGSGWRRVFLQVRVVSTAAPSLAVGQAVASAVPRTHRAPPGGRAPRRPVLPCRAFTPVPPPTVRQNAPSPPPSPGCESTPRRNGSRRSTRHVWLRQPPPAPATPARNNTRRAAAARSPAGPVGAPEALGGRGCTDPWARRAASGLLQSPAAFRAAACRGPRTCRAALTAPPCCRPTATTGTTRSSVPRPQGPAPATRVSPGEDPACTPGRNRPPVHVPPGQVIGRGFTPPGPDGSTLAVAVPSGGAGTARSR